MNSDFFDWILVGDGVAAHAARIELASLAPGMRGLQVAAARKASRFRVGEHLSAAANPILKELGLWEAFVAEGYLEASSSYSCWGSSLLDERNAWGDARGSGWSIDRQSFEGWMSRQAQSVNFCEQISSSVTRMGCIEEGSASMTLEGGETVRGRFVLDASGRSAVVARSCTKRERMDRLTATYNYFEQVDCEVDPTPGPMVEAQSGGWLYSALLPERRLIVAWFTDSDLVAKAADHEVPEVARTRMWEKRIAASRYTLKRIETAGFSFERLCLPAAAIADASTRLNHSVAGARWAAVGDAAGTFDPLASHGLVTALWSGRKAAAAMVESLSGNEQPLAEYNTSFIDGMKKLRRQLHVYYRSERRFQDPFWERRQVNC